VSAILPWWWRWALLAALCAASAGFGYVKGLDHNSDKIASLQGQIEAATAIGLQAEKRTEAINKKTAEIKKEVDHENTATHTADHADSARMRNIRASGSFVPIRSGTSGSPEETCFDRGKLESAIQRFDDGASRVVGKGEDAVIDLNTGKEWVILLKDARAMSL